MGYDIWSEFYDVYPNPTVASDELNFPQFYRHEAQIKALEIGCGTGRHTQRLWAQQNQVTAIDISEGMLEKARQKIPSGVDFIFGDFMTVELPLAGYDVAIMILVLE